MEIKWAIIAVVIIIGMMSIGMALEEYNISQCRIAAIEAGKNSTEIAAICK